MLQNNRALFPLPLFHALAQMGLEQDRACRRFSFPTDVRSTDDAFEITTDLPGLDASRVSVDVEGSQLTIAIKDSPEPSDQASDSKSDDDTGWISRERRPLKGQRVFNFSDAQSVDLDRLSAKLHAGVLTVRVPKKKTPARSVSIETVPAQV